MNTISVDHLEKKANDDWLRVNIGKPNFDGLKEIDEEHNDRRTFDRGLNDIRTRLHTITSGEQSTLREQYRLAGYVPSSCSAQLNKQYNEWTLSILFHREDSDLGDIQKPFYEEIGIEGYRALLNTGNLTKEDILKYMEDIAKSLFDYPYISDEENLGYAPHAIINTKRIYCLGYAIIFYAFSEILQLDQYILGNENHIMPGIKIGDQYFYIDPSNSETLFSFSQGELDVGYILHRGKPFFYDPNPSNALMGGMYNNLADTYLFQGKYELALIHAQRAIMLCNDKGFRDTLSEIEIRLSSNHSIFS